jgi:N-acetylneuraminic acid mutarotase
MWPQFLISILLSFSFPLYSVSAYPNIQATNPKTGCWQQLPSLSRGPRQEHGVASIDSNVYLIGGMIHGPAIPTAASASVEVFNTVTSKWTDAAPLPIAMHHPNVVTVDGKIYVLGGVTIKNGSWDSLGNVLRYDPGVNKWEELESMPAGTGRGASAIGVSGKRVYLAGGIQIPRLGAERIAVSTVQSYDTVTGKWTTLPNLGTDEGRDHGGGAVINGTFYVVGGRDGLRTSVRGTVYALDLSSPNSTWVTKTPMPTPRGGIAVAAVGTKIYAFGGEGNPAPGSKGVFTSTEVYDVAKDSWESEAPMKLPRHGLQAVTIGDDIYLPGGGEKEAFGLDTDYFDRLKTDGSC